MWQSIINLIMAMFIFISGMVSWRKTNYQIHLFDGLGFLCFGIRHIFKVINLTQQTPLSWLEDGSIMDWTLIIVRIIGYLLYFWAAAAASRKNKSLGIYSIPKVIDL